MHLERYALDALVEIRTKIRESLPRNVSSFRLRARLGFSIPSLFSGQRGITPAFGYSAPHLGYGHPRLLRLD